MATKTKEKTKIEEKFIIVVNDDDDDYATDFLSEAQVIERANDMRKEFIRDKVDPELIKECFPKTFKTLKEAEAWFREAVGETIIKVPEKLNETQRILKRTFENNGTINGEIKRKEDYFDQGSWVFSLKVLDIDENMNARLQLEAKKLCPSRAWDNGIKVVAHPKISLYQFDKELNATITQIIHRFFRSNKGTSGYGYKVLSYSL